MLNSLKQMMLSGLVNSGQKMLMDVNKLCEGMGQFGAGQIHRYLDSNLRF